MPRPFLSVRIFGPAGSSRTLMLVDSGSDGTILPMQFARIIGLRFGGERAELGSFAGETLAGEVTEARFVFGRGAFS